VPVLGGVGVGVVGDGSWLLLVSLCKFVVLSLFLVFVLVLVFVRKRKERNEIALPILE